MFETVTNWLGKNEKLAVFLIVLAFILIRLPGIHFPLHQDEYKWPMVVNPASTSGVSIPHPPLSEFIYRAAGLIVGFNVNFRFVPLFFGVLNLLLLYYFLKTFFGRKEAIIGSVIWTLSFFSILASLMVDTDGEILPFFFLLSLIAYYKLQTAKEKMVYLWTALLIIFCVLGFMVKVSFVIAIGAIFVDFLWSKRKNMTKRDVLKYLGFAVFVSAGLSILLLVAHFAFSFFDLSRALVYWEHFIVSNRGWFQTGVECAKALLYTSPFLIVVPLFGSKEDFSKVRPFVFFLFFAFIFYIVLFDFSIGALDRYLQLLILPLTVLSSIILSQLEIKTKAAKKFLFFGIVAGITLFLLQLLPHYVPPLHPKAEWITRLLSLKWNFVYPFSGGSGPLGFYVSFLFTALSWVLSFFILIWAKWKSQYRWLVLVFLIPIGLFYNLGFTEEYLVGYINGHAPTLVEHAVEFIKNDPNIKMVTVYNDNGGNEIQQIGKYRKRLYIDPKLNQNKKIKSFNQYKEHYFVLDVPRFDPNSFYQKYFDSCVVIYKDVDKKMSATIYDCTGRSDLTF